MGNPKEFCDKMDEWAKLAAPPGWQGVRLAISKSCLLDRMMYGDEKPSKTPCPVHKGQWSGCHFRWPGRIWVSLVERDGHKKGDAWWVEVGSMEQQWFNEGCRCAYHKCGCTTGWNPDEHCGCGGYEARLEAVYADYPYLREEVNDGRKTRVDQG